MYRDKERYGQDPTRVVRSKPGTFRAPLSPSKYPPGIIIFTCSWSDWFHEDADPWRDEAWSIIRARPDAIFQILTKRSDRVREHLPADWGDGYPNVWLGVSVEDDRQHKRLDDLRDVPAIVRFVSAEPLIGDARLRGKLKGYHWLITGGESGARETSRPMHPRWAWEALRAGAEEGLALLHKQNGNWLVADDPATGREGDVWVSGMTGTQPWRRDEMHPSPPSLMRYVGDKKTAGRLVYGRLYDDYPSPPGWTRDASTGLWSRA